VNNVQGLHYEAIHRVWWLIDMSRCRCGAGLLVRIPFLEWQLWFRVGETGEEQTEELDKTFLDIAFEKMPSKRRPPPSCQNITGLTKRVSNCDQPAFSPVTKGTSYRERLFSPPFAPSRINLEFRLRLHRIPLRHVRELRDIRLVEM